MEVTVCVWGVWRNAEEIEGGRKGNEEEIREEGENMRRLFMGNMKDDKNERIEMEEKMNDRKRKMERE